MMTSRASALLIAIALCPALLPAQQSFSAPAPVTAVIYTVQDLSGPGTTHDYEQTITDALAAAFTASGSFRLIAQADWQAGARSRSLSERALLAGAAASELARGLKADVAVSGSYTVVDDGGTERILLTVQCWDAARERLSAGFIRASRFDLGFYLSLRAWVAGLIPAIRIAPPSQPVAKPAARTTSAPLLPQITFESVDDGMEVLVAGDLSAGTISGGKLEFAAGGVPQGTVLQITKRKSGYHDSVQKVKAAPVITLTPLVKKSSFAAQVDWTIGEVLGAGGAFRWYPVPDALFASAGVYLFAQPPLTLAPRAVLHGDASVGFGGYLFFPPDSPVRLSVQTGGGVVLSVFTQPGFPVYADYYLNVVGLGVETRVLGFPLFLRIDSRYSLGLTGGLVPRGTVRSGLPLVTLGALFRW
jgi:hypothetical protein